MARPTRLGKAAGEFNVGISTIVEFLVSKGVDIDSSPNTKLTPDQYEMLRTEFAADQDLKEQSKLKTAPREKRETISLRDKGAKEEAPAVEEVEAVKKKEPSKKEEKEEEGPKKVQVVGKIDLDAINTKTRPEKKTKEEELKRRESDLLAFKDQMKPVTVERDELKRERDELETKVT